MFPNLVGVNESKNNIKLLPTTLATIMDSELILDTKHENYKLKKGHVTNEENIKSLPYTQITLYNHAKRI